MSISSVVRKEWNLELKNRSAVGGLMLYAVSTIYVSYLSFRKINDVATWNALLWVILLFASFNVAGRSFDKESGGRELYLYMLVGPVPLILGKILFNALLMSVLSLFSLAVYLLLIGSQAVSGVDWTTFLLAVTLGSFGFASILTLISALAAKTDNSPGLMAILGFPVILPFLLTLIRFSKNALDGIAWSVNAPYALILSCLIMAVLALAYVLFPYIWRD